MIGDERTWDPAARAPESPDDAYYADLAAKVVAFAKARDAYVRAWLVWEETELGIGADPRQEAEFIQIQLEEALKARRTERAKGQAAPQP